MKLITTAVNEISLDVLQRVTKVLKESKGVDFGNYAFSSYRRRIVRFMEINKIRDIDLFVEKIKTDANYADHLVKELETKIYPVDGLSLS